RQQHNTELQALGAMDAHDLYAAGDTAGGHHRLLPVFQQAAQLADKGKEAPVTGLLKGAGILAEGDEILPPPLSPLHGAEHAQNIQAVKQPPEEAVYAQILGLVPQKGQLLQE